MQQETVTEDCKGGRKNNTELKLIDNGCRNGMDQQNCLALIGTFMGA